MNRGLFTSDAEDWGTPQFLFDALDAEFNFTLDACASHTNAKCDRYFTKTDDALQCAWRGRVWLNPPYGRTIGDFLGHAHAQVILGNAELVAALVPMRSETKWFHAFAMRAAEIRLLNKRLTFETPRGTEYALKGHNAPFPSAVIIFKKTQEPLKISAYDVITRAAQWSR